MTRAELDRNPAAVSAMFDQVAPKYDLANEVLSFGQARRWRKIVTQTLDIQLGELVLDLAAGTGTSSAPLRQQGAFVVPTDFSLGMLQVGKQRHPDLPFVAGDGTRLPFRDSVFDAVTISFGLRNIVDLAGALGELRRVTKPGGRLLICEFSHPTQPWFYKIYFNYLMRALPPIARKVAANPDAYVYLAESIQDWPNQDELAQHILAAGWERVAHRNLTGGIVALHRGFNPKPNLDS